MRMWNIDPRLMCKRHVLGEHCEMHMFLGSILKGKSIQGYIDKGLVDPGSIMARHSELEDEMIARGYKHNIDDNMSLFSNKTAEIKKEILIKTYGKETFNIDAKKNLKELYDRCPDCRRRIVEEGL